MKLFKSEKCRFCGKIKNQSLFYNACLIAIYGFSFIGAAYFGTELVAQKDTRFELYAPKYNLEKNQQIKDMAEHYSSNVEMINFVSATVKTIRIKENKTHITDRQMIEILQTITSGLDAIPDPVGHDILYNPIFTLENGGDCEDLTTLFLTMAKIEGLDCYPVMTRGHVFAACSVGSEIVFVEPQANHTGLIADSVTDGMLKIG